MPNNRDRGVIAVSYTHLEGIPESAPGEDPSARPGYHTGNACRSGQTNQRPGRPYRSGKAGAFPDDNQHVYGGDGYLESDYA